MNNKCFFRLQNYHENFTGSLPKTREKLPIFRGSRAKAAPIMMVQSIGLQKSRRYTDRAHKKFTCRRHSCGRPFQETSSAIFKVLIAVFRDSTRPASICSTTLFSFSMRLIVIKFILCFYTVTSRIMPSEPIRQLSKYPSPVTLGPLKHSYPVAGHRGLSMHIQ